MLRLVQVGNALPFSYPVDPNASFQPGMIAQLRLYGNNIVCGVSDGSAPFGIIDDVKATAFYQPSIDEVVVVPAVGTLGPDGKYRSVIDIMGILENSNILQDSFISDVPVFLKEKNGVIIIPAGTILNNDQTGSGIPDSVKITVSYSYQLAGIAGDDSTIASKRVTVWFSRGIYECDVFEVSQRYPLNALLFVNESGQLTTRQITATSPAVAFVCGPPTSRLSSLQFLWL